jgi:hypothetical protein
MDDRHAADRTLPGEALQSYLRRITAIPLLTPAEEVHLGTIVQRWRQAPQPAVADAPGVKRLRADATSASLPR